MGCGEYNGYIMLPTRKNTEKQRDKRKYFKEAKMFTGKKAKAYGNTEKEVEMNLKGMIDKML